MVYQIEIPKGVREEDLPKLEKSGINFQILDKQFKKIKANPYICSVSKSGDLGDCRAVNWGNGYRIVFKIMEKDKKVIIVSIDKHDDAYRKAKKRRS